MASPWLRLCPVHDELCISANTNYIATTSETWTVIRKLVFLVAKRRPTWDAG